MTPSRRWLLLGLVVIWAGLLSACQPRPTPTPTLQPTAPPPPTPTVSAGPQVQRIKYAAANAYLIVEILQDDIVHFEYSAALPGPETSAPLYTTPMVFKTDYAGPSRFSNDSQGHLETGALKLAVDAQSLCLAVTDIQLHPPAPLTTVCPQDLGGDHQALTLTPEQTRHLYGLGEHFVQPNTPNGDWLGQKVTPGSAAGNAMLSFSGGSAGNAQFPVMYALSQNSYALFLDQLYAVTWDFSVTPWVASMAGQQIRGYVLSKHDLPGLRADYMALVGRPLVPPKKMFGLWVSEYGFDNWAELEDKLRTLRANRFPVDGFVMDLQWFGGVSRPSHMGALTWDTANFPDPAGEIARLRDEQGVGLMTIEESYVDASLPEYDTLARLGYMPRLGGPDGAPMKFPGWWGTGGMLDWTNPAASAYWHNTKRQPLVDMGILGHWTDLGEPELFHIKNWYAGFPALNLHAHRDIHNLYNFLWAQSIYAGYLRHAGSGPAQRPFILSRSGTAGIQRFGTSLWSGDLASNFGALGTQLNAQLHMSLAGVDYYGSDVGGFVRRALDGNANVLYTQWLADSLAFDVPVRPHTDNQCNCYETAPDRIGDLPSNLANVRLRYQLIPYLYSLAHRAYLYGEPVVPPLVFYYQNDPNVADLGDEKLIGRDLLAATVSAYGETQRDVYLPAGTWVNYHTQTWINSRGEWLKNVPVMADGRLQLPLYARAGAILPQMYVDEQTLNALGQRADGTRRDELVVRVYASAQPTRFTLYEDDGTTLAYQSGAVRLTPISQQLTGEGVTVTVAAASGTYSGALASRSHTLQLVVPQGQAAQVALNGRPLAQQATPAALDTAASGWCNAQGMILIKTGVMDVTTEKQVAVRLQTP